MPDTVGTHIERTNPNWVEKKTQQQQHLYIPQMRGFPSETRCSTLEGHVFLERKYRMWWNICTEPPAIIYFFWSMCRSMVWSKEAWTMSLEVFQLRDSLWRLGDTMVFHLFIHRMAVTLEEKGGNIGSKQLVTLMVLRKILFPWARGQHSGIWGCWQRMESATKLGKNVFGQWHQRASKKRLLWVAEWTAVVFVCLVSICHLLSIASWALKGSHSSSTQNLCGESGSILCFGTKNSLPKSQRPVQRWPHHPLWTNERCCWDLAQMIGNEVCFFP